MHVKGFRKAGNIPTLFASFLYFDISFMVWVLFGVLGIFIAKDFGLTATQKALLASIPTLGGSLFRIPLGYCADRFGAKRTGIISMILTIIPLLLSWLLANRVTELYVFGFLLGISGASFAVALPLVSRWYPPEYQGLAMGIAGAGNTGTLIATFFAARIAKVIGWHGVFGLAILPMILTLFVFILMAKDSPTPAKQKTWNEYGRLLKKSDLWFLCILYSITFGGFVGFSSYLGIFLHDQYRLKPIEIANITTILVSLGSFLRPVGGYLSDKIGGGKMLILLLGVIGIAYIGLSSLPPLMLAIILFGIIMMALGMGNGAVFQVVPQLFPDEIGIVTGVVGEAGGLGGFFLPMILGKGKDLTGSFGAGFMVCGIFILLVLVMLVAVQKRWAITARQTLHSIQIDA
ncbi:NarK/NasA family nitrate transporter [Fodinisporobacter ferrooxydans]|uniref:NarK/NasA family nitrate transporter n=1 Tax=Fodinisporobacter ferrooxydans TaxID=2901836 RepID=A0ABY4CQE1_9BACL|nr:NarK/NasA family nitrate transporter [Alicyclobacillaceae bacterium MYW30-H2]